MISATAGRLAPVTARVFRMCSSDGSCVPITCCTLVLRLSGPGGVPGPEYPYPATKGDCLSCTPPVAGTCIANVQGPPGGGSGPVQANRACD
jgi:hypothetical protein